MAKRSKAKKRRVKGQTNWGNHPTRRGEKMLKGPWRLVSEFARISGNAD